PKMRIEEAAARKQARIDAAKDIIVGVNRYQPDEETALELLEVDNSAVRTKQIAQLEKLRNERNEGDVERALANLTACAKTGKGNLLEFAVEAARKRATLGEISRSEERRVGKECRARGEQKQ